MYIILWAYQVKPEHVVQFEEIYSSDGIWARLFQRSQGFLGTELFRDDNDPLRYITLDRWASAQDYESFLLHWKTEYANMDTQHEGLMTKEILLGKYEVISG